MLLALASVITLTVGFTVFSIISDLKNKSIVQKEGKASSLGTVELISNVPTPKRENSITTVNFNLLEMDKKREKAISKGR